MTYGTQKQSSNYSGPQRSLSTYSSNGVTGCCNRGCRPCVKDFR